MDVVAHGGAVTGGVVVTEDGDPFALPERYLQRERDEVCLGIVVLAPLAGGGGPGRVEVAQRRVAEAVDAIQPMEDALQDVLGLTVRAAGDDPFLLVDRHALRIIEQIGGGGEDEAAHAVGHGLLQQVQAVGDVVAHVHEGLFHGFAHQCVGGEVHHRLDVVRVEQGLDGSPVGQFPLDEDGLRVDGGPVAVVQVVEDDDSVALFDQFLGDDAADVASAAGDQDVHL